MERDSVPQGEILARGTHQRYLMLLASMAGAGEGLDLPGFVVVQ